MQHRSAMKACSLVLLLFTLSISVEASDDWNYHDQDDWVLVSKECGGASQSPINIHRDTLVVDEKLQLDFVNYNASILAFKAMNNYHSIKLNYIGDANSAPRVSGPAINFENYTLEQFHFHWGSKRGVGSEHVIDGLPYSMEMHLVHYNRAKYRSISKALESREGILVVAVLFKIHRENNPHFQELARLVSELKDRDQSYHINPEEPLVVGNMMPAKEHWNRFYYYQGSLTTPPCTEGVKWFVLSEPIYIGLEQINEFRRVQDNHGRNVSDNYRASQDLAGRKVFANFKQAQRFAASGAPNSMPMAGSVLALTVFFQVIFGRH